MSESDIVGTWEQFWAGIHTSQLHHNILDFAAADGAGAPTSIANANEGESSAPEAATQGSGLGEAQGIPVISSSSASPDTSAAPVAAAAVSLNQAGGGVAFPTSDSAKANVTGKRRERSKGCTNKKSTKASGSGNTVIPYVLMVKAGEDVLSKIVALARASARNFCILTANGSISKVALTQPSTADETVDTYEGRFEIITLRGSLFYNKKRNENDVEQRRVGGVSVSLAGPDARVIGGRVEGLLIAASTVQIILGSFVGDLAPIHPSLESDNGGINICASVSP
ncbi:hypothetical protein RJT34_08285 [Clitoria ternatea]|uniref:AT-hook motif nuclear-localized protein n=1 Tax=Clitoria ternatea TaxID=43366 RepID=A0AAN9PSP7_CLITE